MINIRKRLRGLLAGQDEWKKIMEAAGRTRVGASNSVSSFRLTEALKFGSNPGALRMFTHVPPNLPDQSPLVAVLHGCTQSAGGYALGAGWSTLADRFGFALLLPEQRRANNPNGCFNWFRPGDIARGRGEAASIGQMVAHMISDYCIDPDRVFITGLSAGGAMTSVMLATYPEIFAGGAIIAGLPYGAANNVQQAFENMYKCPAHPARVWGDLVRRASSHKGPWPRVSVWHGGADTTVIPPNAAEIIKQWTDVHGLSPRPSLEELVDDYPRQVWTNSAGEEVIESYSIPGMAHGTPLAVGLSDRQCGVAGPFLLEVGISSSYHIARFFGIAAPRRSRESIEHTMSRVVEETSAERPSPLEPLEGEVLESNSPRGAKSPPLDIAAVITNALRTAGLVKGG